MGAWGYGLFQSDDDFEIIMEQSHQTGLTKLEEDAMTTAEKTGKQKEVSYSLYAEACSDVAKVRAFLDTADATTGIAPLQKLLAKWEAKARLPQNFDEDFYRPGYVFIVIGACAMTLGCRLSEANLKAMREIFLDCGLMPDSLQEIDAALNGPRAYKGEPYNFGALGFDSVSETPRQPNAFGVIGMNVPSPHGLFRGPDTSKLVAKIKARMEAYQQEKAKDVCGTCGATGDKQGEALLVCAKCKSRSYCSSKCQKENWVTHKLVCMKPADIAAKDPLRTNASKSFQAMANSSFGIPQAPRMMVGSSLSGGSVFMKQV